MIGSSADGDLIAGVACRTGCGGQPGKFPSKGGKTAMMEVTNYLKENWPCRAYPTAPGAPWEKVKPGVVSIAPAADAMIVPFYLEADRAWFFNSWDRFFIPKPFARVTLRYDNMIRLSCPVRKPNLRRSGNKSKPGCCRD
ncbi:MAG: hypothetical protein R2875_13745 [Desulfobacterales bacterium]